MEGYNQKFGESTEKTKQRNKAVEYRGETYKNALVFPTPLCPDVKAGLKSGIFDSKTNVYAIEKIHEKVGPIKRNLKRLISGFNIDNVFEGEAYKFNYAKYFSDEKLEYSFYDACGNLNAKDVGCFFKNRHYFADGMRFALTIKINHQFLANKFHNAVQEVCGTGLLKQVEILLENANDSGFRKIGEGTKEHLYSQLNALYLCFPDRKLEIKDIAIYRNKDISKMASYMVFVDMRIHNTEMNIRTYNKFRALMEVFNEKVTYTSRIRFERKKTGRKQVEKIEPEIKCSYDIMNKLDLFEYYNNIEDVPRAKMAWITILANKAGLDPEKTKQKIANKLAKWAA